MGGCTASSTRAVQEQTSAQRHSEGQLLPVAAAAAAAATLLPNPCLTCAPPCLLRPLGLLLLLPAGPKGIAAILAQAPEIMLCKPTTNDRWDRRAVELSAYLLHHGHCNVPEVGASEWMGGEEGGRQAGRREVLGCTLALPLLLPLAACRPHHYCLPACLPGCRLPGRACRTGTSIQSWGCGSSGSALHAQRGSSGVAPPACLAAGVCRRLPQCRSAPDSLLMSCLLPLLPDTCLMPRLPAVLICLPQR